MQNIKENTMPTININIRMDSKLKKDFEEFCQDVGMSMSTAFTLFAKRTVRDNQIPFEISREIPNKETRATLEDVENGRNLSRPYTNLDELMEDLNA